MDHELDFGPTDSDRLYEPEYPRGDEPVLLGYGSSRNISFRGEIETGYTRAEWATMDEDERDEVTAELLANLVDYWVVDEPELPR